MRKAMLFGLVSFVLLNPILAQSIFSDEPPYKYYENTQFEIKLLYPEGWHIVDVVHNSEEYEAISRDGRQKEDLIVVFSDQLASKKRPFIIQVVKRDWQNELFKDITSDASLRLFKMMDNKDTTIQPAQLDTINNKKFVTNIAKAVGLGGEVVRSEFLYQKGDVLYGFLCDSDASEYTSLHSICRKIAGSLEFY